MPATPTTRDGTGGGVNYNEWAFDHLPTIERS